MLDKARPAWSAIPSGPLGLFQGFAGEGHFLSCHRRHFEVTEMQMEEKGSGTSVITAQVSLYPLRQESIEPAIREAVSILRRHGLESRVGEMSTLVWGEERAVFAALEEAFHQTAERGDTVMAVTLSNACPSPRDPR
jgi:uncharacterized protein YqgV (UPF0045/DUF77 family)